MDKDRILVIEDDKSIINFLSISLRTNQYEVDVAETGLMGISLFSTRKPDLILLDLGLPDVDGMEIIKQIRLTSATPIIVISAREQDEEKVAALDLGADDYMTKPFSIQELLARIRVCFRKAVPGITEENIYEAGGLRIDYDLRQVTVDNESVHLTPIEYKILLLLVKNSGKVLTHKYLQDEVWGHTNEKECQSLRVFMANIRKKIEKDTNQPRYIVTEIGVGYRFVAKP